MTPGNDLTIPTASMASGVGAPVWAPCGPAMDRREIDERAPLGRPPASLSAERWQLGGDPLVPPVHARLAFGAGRAWWELIEVRLLELLAGGQKLLAGVVDDGTGEHIEAPELSGQHLRERVLHELDVGGW